MARLLYSIPDAAETIGIGRSMLYEFIADGLIHPVKIGRRTLIPHEELERFVREIVESSTSDPAA